MRIISQSGLLDVPYELIAISPYSAIGAKVIAWMPLPKPYKEGEDE